jgi:RNA polymerase sigma factor (TIGR02999 family)
MGVLKGLRRNLQIMGSETPSEVTRILSRIQDGDASAAAVLLPLVYDELRGLAAGYFRAEDPNHTLQPTAIVHEAYLRLAQQPDARWEGRNHFLAVAAKAMRNLLINHARDRRAQKRGGGLKRITLSSGLNATDDSSVDLLDLDDVLQKLETMNERHARIVELRIFSGLTIEETAKVLGISETTVSADWSIARAWLKARLRSGAGS